MSAFDWAVVFICLPALFLPAFRARSTGRRSASDRFAAGRKTPWLVLGGSLAAARLSADTPLLVAGAFYKGGLAGNWFWLAGAPGSLATMFFFARYWRRSGVLTEPEILALRHGMSRPTRWLRITMAIFDGALVNLLVIATAVYAVCLLLKNITGLSDASIIVGPLSASPISLATSALMMLTAVYTATSGFKGVARSEVIQFAAAVIASTFVAAFALAAGLKDFGGLDMVMRRLPGGRAPLFDLFRSNDSSFLLLIFFGWWQSTPGNGAYVQRLVSARTEADAALTALLFTFLHYVLRAWPWFAIGALALVYFPHLHDSEMAYPMMAKRFLPVGGGGLIVVVFVAAFMSNVASRLNWGASYFVNDVYGAFGKDRNSRNARRIELAAIVGLSSVGFVIAQTGLITSLAVIYKYLLIIQSGAAFAAIARWYWWRITIWSEIAALGSSVLIGNALAAAMDLSTNIGFARVLAMNSLACGVITIAVALRTSRNGPSDACRQFYNRTRVTGPGWNSLRDRSSASTNDPPVSRTLLNWLSSIVLIYGSISAISSFLSARMPVFFLSVGAVFAAACWLWIDRREVLRVLGGSTVATDLSAAVEKSGDG